MKLSNGLKDALLAQLLTNFRLGLNVGANTAGYRIRFFDSNQLSTPYSFESSPEFNSTYFQASTPAGLLLDFGFSIGIPSTAFTTSGRSIKLLGTYTENAKISGTADIACIFACVNFPTVHGYAMSAMSTINKILITNSVVPNGQQGAFVLTQTVMNAGDSVSIADFTLNLIEP